MTASFLNSHQDYQRSLILVPEELSGMLHSIALSVQLHRKAQIDFRPATETVCLNRHCGFGQITGKIAHLSLPSMRL